MTGTLKVDLEKLRQLYGTDQAARLILDHFASRERNWRESSVDRTLENVKNAGHEITRGDVIRTYKALEECGCGTFKAGRKGWASRFEWTAQMVSVGQAASGETERVEETVEGEAEEEEPMAALKHVFRLRTDVTVSFELPSDFTPAEADRLAAFVKTLPFETGPSER